MDLLKINKKAFMMNNKSIQIMIFIVFIVILIAIPALEVIAQSTWAHAYGGVNNESAYSIKQTSEGGYIVAGYAGSFGTGSIDLWVLKLDASGGIVWQKTYGGSDNDVVHSIEQTSDGGYIVAAYTQSFGAGSSDFWVLKLDASGEIIWQKTYGEGLQDNAYSIKQIIDGGYIVAGFTDYFGAGNWDVLMLKLDANGGIVWQKTYGGSNQDFVDSIQQTTDTGYIIAGYTHSFEIGGGDIWVIKLDASGGIVWQRTYGLGGIDNAESIQQTTDGGYIVVGTTLSFGAGAEDLWVLKLDPSGGIIWQKTYGGSSNDYAESIQQTTDGGYIVVGTTLSFGAGNYDFWVLKLDASGEIIWQNTYGGAGWDEANAVHQTSDEGYLVAGGTDSFGSGNSDLWVLKLDSFGNMDTTCTFIIDTSIMPINSSAMATDTTISPAVSSAIIANTGVSAVDSYGTDILICSTALSLPGGVPDNDNYAGVPLTMLKSGSDLYLSWGSPSGTCITQDYSIYRGTLPWTGYNYSPEVCTTSGETFAIIPADSDSYYYIIAAQNGGNEGSYGLDSSNEQRPASSASCLPQQIGSCN
ncbi:MAG: hypothetical protein A2Y62_11115 [Candidatus Fischerbacteria bacterium RBG_13_37_8]|uniref:Fibronectin type-III domain-containing protein n=1 Tax=Candidatus Fischerbacteria bacterium RBG_13_37_8 TaxID=1817863 RepID=A0A1F5V6Z0_9BACT|nr:MAG: hypothetical protein A2Y62_11115 [Candidatus Fischerbacteria bacterium RBG_13_37_8]